MEVIKWANGKGDTLKLTAREAEILRDTLDEAIVAANAECAFASVEIETES